MSTIRKVTIDHQLAEIGVQATPARMRITRPAMEMTVTTENPQMEIEKQAPKFRINRKKINAESGLKPPREMTMDFRNSGKTGALRGAKTAVNDGNFLGNTKEPGDKVGKLARVKTMSEIQKKQGQTNIGLMPKSSPEVVWDRGSMRINWSKHSIVIDWDGEYMPQVTIDPKYSIEIFLRTEPYFRVMVEDVVDPSMPGLYVDQAI
jgi:hypothetical protein